MTDLLTAEERAECERLGLSCGFERSLPPDDPRSLLSAWSADGKTLCFCHDGDGIVVDAYPRARNPCSVTFAAIDIERMAFIVRVCKRIADEAGEAAGE